jgi:hypothetical protein
MKISLKVMATLKLLLATVLIAGLLVYAAQSLWPEVDTLTAVLWVAFGFAVLIIGAFAGALFWLPLEQFILRHGGIDTLWLWFDHDPPGLEEMLRHAHRNGNGQEGY